MLNELGTRLKLQREKNCLTRQQVAELVGISKSLVGLYETGERYPSLSVLIKLATQYTVSVDYLLGTEINTSNSVSLQGLSDKQIQAVKTIIEGLRNSTDA